MVQKANVTLDNVSPLIKYSPAGAWIDGSTADPFWHSYDNNGTFTVTTTYGASASLTFNGTAIWIYGAKRGNHGPYNTTLDGRTFTDNGFYDGQLFQQVLFSAVELNGTEPHTVSITNSRTDTERPFLDVDSIVYQVEIPDDYQEVKQSDTSSAFRYSPSDGWSTYNGNTGHATLLGDAYVDYTFEGSHLELYGVVGPSGGPYTVKLDNGLSMTFNASSNKFSPRVVLYQDSRLSPGRHTMRITNAPFSGQTLSIDYAVIRRPSNSTDIGGDSPPPSSSFSGGAIGGIVAGICGLIIIALVGSFFWYRRRHRRAAILPQEVLQAEFANDNNDSVELSSAHLTPFLQSTITRYPATLPPAPLPPPSSGYDSPGQTGPSSASRFVVHNADNAVVGSRSPFEVVDEKRRLAMRERDPQVEGREQDFGPIIPIAGNDEDLLPPDYHQATRHSIRENR